MDTRTYEEKAAAAAAASAVAELEVRRRDFKFSYGGGSLNNDGEKKPHQVVIVEIIAKCRNRDITRILSEECSVIAMMSLFGLLRDRSAITKYINGEQGVDGLYRSGAVITASFDRGEKIDWAGLFGELGREKCLPKNINKHNFFPDLHALLRLEEHGGEIIITFK